MKKAAAPSDIDSYLATFPEDVQQKLQAVREAIQLAAPTAAEAIKYQMPTFVLHGNLVHFAGCKNHLGFYPTPSAITAFAQEFSNYVTSKGAVQFPLDKPIPLTLIKKVVKFRVKENEEKAAAKAKKKATRKKANRH